MLNFAALLLLGDVFYLQAVNINRMKELLSGVTGSTEEESFVCAPPTLVCI